MDHRAIKRPRGESGDKIKKPLKKKQKKSKSNKGSHDRNKDGPGHSSLEATATAEGKTMAQVLSTFHRLERSRFEAFRRSTFPANVVSAYVAHCLAASHERARERHIRLSSLYGDNNLLPSTVLQSATAIQSSNHQQKQQHASKRKQQSSLLRNRRSLSDMVAPGQAEEITAIVSTLAKAYAQRLVTAARSLAASRGVSDETPLTPQLVREAHEARVKMGLDPGFFLRPSVGTTGAKSSLVHVTEESHRMGRLKHEAALAAQEEYDKYQQEKKEQTVTKESSGDAVEDGKMEVEETGVNGQATDEKTTSEGGRGK